jgi:FkbM family methyltransferase
MVLNIFKFIWLFIKQFPQWLFSKKSYQIEYEGQKLVFNPQSVDPFTFYEVYIDEQYDTKTRGSKNIIVDVGGNVGLYSLWATKKYHPKKIIAIEMDKQNCKYFQSTIETNNLQNSVQIINGAFYNKKTNVGEDYYSKFFNSCHKLDDKKKGSIKTITLSEIINLLKGKKIDLIKMDIEGSEKYLISDTNSVLLKKKVKEVAIEVHPQFGSSYDDMKNFLIKSGFKIIRKRFLNPMAGGRINIFNKWKTKIIFM